VIPVYNSEKFLQKSLESVLNQTYKNLEIIAINDGSNDKSLEILQKYSNSMLIISQNNQGLASALTNAIQKITGRWFKWMSPDDVLYPHAIETLVNEAKNLPENTIIYSNWELIDEKENKLGIFSESNYNDLKNFDYNIRLLDNQIINVNTTLIPSSLFKKGCVVQELDDPVAIDYDFFLRAGILYDTSFQLIPKSLLMYRINSDQLSHQNISKTLSYLSEVKNNILNKLDDIKRKEYRIALKEYNKEKSISKKTMELGLKLTTKIFPDLISDQLLAFYVNYLRRKR